MASLSGWHDGSEPQIGQYIFLRPATAGQEQFLSPQLYNFETGTLVTPYAPRKARAADWSADAEPFRDDRMYNAALRTDYDVTDNLTLTSITSYSDYKRNSRAADDGTAVQDYDYVANDGYIRDFNQELRLSNDAASRMRRSEEHTSELQSLMRISYAVFCLKKKNITNTTKKNTISNK